MTTKPFAIRPEEWDELAEVEVVRQSWGLEGTDGGGVDLARGSYGVRFKFQSFSPGYCGDLYILHGDALGEPMTFIRGRNGKLESA